MIDVDVHKFLWGFSLVSYFVEFIHVLCGAICMALGYNSPNTPSSSSSTWFPKGMCSTFKSRYHIIDNNSVGKGLSILLEEEPPHGGGSEVENSSSPSVLMQQRLNSEVRHEIGKVKISSKIRKRPARLVVPDSHSCLELGQVVNAPTQKEFEMEGKNFFMASRRGRRDVMEDGYEVITDIMGDSKQAFFGVFDGHGGRAAVDFVAENLGKKIVSALREVEQVNDQSKEAIKKSYLATDKEFLSQDVSSGACAATVLVKDGELYVANVGDCRIVLSKKGVATALTSDQRLDREDERSRIENLGGYVNCQNGVWRVQGSLAVSRAIGDLHLKQWVISEPEIKKLELTSDCEFLVIASDGLWDKVSNQEAVDVVMRNNNSIESCKKLVDISSGRGNKDDITVMVVYLQNFRHKGNQITI